MDFVATTSSNSPKVNDASATQGLIGQYWFRDLNVAVDDEGRLDFRGDDWPVAWKIHANGPDRDEDGGDGFEAFLLDIAPHLREPLIVQAIGSEGWQRRMQRACTAVVKHQKQVARLNRELQKLTP